MTNIAESMALSAYITDTIAKLYFSQIAHPLTILDVGCGDAQLTIMLANAFFNANFIGIDINQEFLEQNKKQYPEINFLEPEHLNSIHHKADLIYIVQVLHHIHEDRRKAFIHSILTTLKPSGTMLLIESSSYIYSLKKLFNSAVYECTPLAASFFRHLDLPGYTITINYLYPNYPRIEPYLQTIPLGSLYMVQIKNR